MRQFNLVFKDNEFIINEDGEMYDHKDIIIYTFSPEHSKDITANEFLEIINTSNYTLESIEEIDADT